MVFLVDPKANKIPGQTCSWKQTYGGFCLRKFRTIANYGPSAQVAFTLKWCNNTERQVVLRKPLSMSQKEIIIDFYSNPIKTKKKMSVRKLKPSLPGQA